MTRRTALVAASLVLATATAAVTQNKLSPQFLEGVWEGEWSYSGRGPTGTVVQRDQITFKSDGTFVRRVTDRDNPRTPSLQEGAYTISGDGDSVVLRGTYLGGDRAGQTTSITLRLKSDSLEATIRPPGMPSPIVFAYAKVK